MPEGLSSETLAKSINEWCEQHGIVPANGQAGEAVSERNVRYYRTLGLLDAPTAEGYGEKHLLQLTALRLLQSHGLPLRRIRELLYGRTEDELEEVIRRGLQRGTEVAASARMAMPAADEVWRVIPLNEDFLLMSRRGTALTASQRQTIVAALQNEPARPTDTRIP